MKKIFLLYTIVYLQCLFLLAANQNNLSGNGFNKSGWPLEVLSWDIDKAYPGIEYNYRLGVKGGEYPYNFTLVDGPAGMTINKNTGEILWTPASLLSDEVVIKISDIRGNTLEHQFNITSTTTGFYFVDGANGVDGTNTGSESSPWKTMKYASATADSSSYVYVRKGIYNETFSIASNNCGRFMAYPGESVTLISASTGTTCIGINGGEKRLFQGFNFDGSGRRWFFSVQGYAKNLIWRKNIMHNNGSTDRENPAFIFFWNGGGDPINGLGGYDNVVIQDNVFYDLRDTVSNHCASVTCFDVQDMLYEDNVAHDIDGSGVKDKDMGYMNTIRNNVIYDCGLGIDLMCQGGESGTEVNYNLVYNCNTSINIGLQPGYINDIFIHHNNLLNKMNFSGQISNSESYNINFYHNIVGNGDKMIYDIPLLKDSETGKYHYVDYFTTANYDKVQIDNNLVWSVENNIVGPSWGIPPVSWSEWKIWGLDKNSILANPGLDANYALPATSPYYGIYGRDYNKQITDVKLSENENSYRKEYSLSQNYPNPFNPSTTIKYSIPESPLSGEPVPMHREVRGGFITLKIFDILGREVTTLVNEQKPAGNYTVEWNGTNSAGQLVGSGIYFYQLKTSNGFMETKKMLMIK